MEIEIKERVLKLNTFLKKYRNENFLDYCKDCSNYSNNWSCPPLGFSSDEFFEDFREIYLKGVKIIFTEEEINASINEDMETYSPSLLRKIQNIYTKELLEEETRIVGSKVLLSGACSYCLKCERFFHRPCPWPSKVRYSLDSFGLNITAIAKEEFDTPLVWGRDRLPNYYFLIFGLLY